MPHSYQGDPTDTGDRYAIVVARFNESITSRLLQGAVETLLAAGVDDDRIVVVHAPGAWEIPVIAARLVGSGKYCAVLCLGAVIRGETTHDQYINSQVSQTLGNLAVESGVPVLFGVLTCNTLEQAISRAGGKVGNKGVECALAALEMASLFDQLP